MLDMELQRRIRERKTPLALTLAPDPARLSEKILKNFTDMFGDTPMAQAEALRYHGTTLLDAAEGRLPAVVAEEIRLAKAAGMDDELAAFSKAAATPRDEVQAPPAVPTDEEIHGIDVLDLELAVRCLWKENIYAEAAMGCTGPVVKLAGSSLDKARAVLTASGYL